MRTTYIETNYDTFKNLTYKIIDKRRNNNPALNDRFFKLGDSLLFYIKGYRYVAIIFDKIPYGNEMEGLLIKKNGLVYSVYEDILFNNIEVIRILSENNVDLDWKKVMDLAASNGHLEMVKFLHRNRREGCTTNAMDWAAEHDNLEMVKWLSRNRREGCTTKAMDGAAQNGHLEVVKWLHYNRREGCTAKATYFAAEDGYLDVVKFLLENRSEGIFDYILDRAYVHDHIHIIEYMENLEINGLTSSKRKRSSSKRKRTSSKKKRTSSKKKRTSSKKKRTSSKKKRS